MSRPEVFVDSGAFIGFLDRRDLRHPLLSRLFAQPPRWWSTSSFVVSETYSWFLHRHNEDAARIFLAALTQLPRLEILDAEASYRAAVWRKLEQLRGLRLTYVDASSLVWIEQRGIRIVWGTDRDLAVEGASVEPGP